MALGLRITFARLGSCFNIVVIPKIFDYSNCKLKICM